MVSVDVKPHVSFPFWMMYLWWSSYTLYLLACQMELPLAIQVFVVVSLVCRALIFPFVCLFVCFSPSLCVKLLYVLMSPSRGFRMSFCGFLISACESICVHLCRLMHVHSGKYTQMLSQTEKTIIFAQSYDPQKLSRKPQDFFFLNTSHRNFHSFIQSMGRVLRSSQD